jgi:hypothetical protein
MKKMVARTLSDLVTKAQALDIESTRAAASILRSVSSGALRESGTGSLFCINRRAVHSITINCPFTARPRIQIRREVIALEREGHILKKFMAFFFKEPVHDAKYLLSSGDKRGVQNRAFLDLSYLLRAFFDKSFHRDAPDPLELDSCAFDNLVNTFDLPCATGS